MQFCEGHEADILIDGKPYRFDDIGGYAALMERQRRYRGLEFTDEGVTLGRLLNEARARAEKNDTKYIAPKKIKERLRLLTNFKPTPLHGGYE